jgi:AAA+ ATPase superfamily predicted ATPase
MNPFKYGTVVSGRDFCGRQTLLKQIIEHIESSQRIVILGERRIGKTSAVCEAVRKCKGLRLLYVDLLGIKSSDALCRRILRAIVLLQKKSGWMEKIIKSLAYLKPTISVDPITSMPTISFDASVEMQANSIPEVLSLIDSISKTHRLVVIFDEFQDTMNLADAHEALALLRSSIQFQALIPYIFVGSIRHQMHEIFTDHESPFFKSAIPLSVNPLPFEIFSKFLKKKFASGNRKIATAVLEKVFAIANDIPGDIQQLCEALWEITTEKETIDANNLKSALELIFAREQKSYENYIGLLTNIQYQCLLAIAKQGGTHVYSVAFLKSAGFNNPSTVRRAITRLTHLNIVFASDGIYQFINPFFRAWLLQQG